MGPPESAWSQTCLARGSSAQPAPAVCVCPALSPELSLEDDVSGRALLLQVWSPGFSLARSCHWARGLQQVPSALSSVPNPGHGGRWALSHRPGILKSGGSASLQQVTKRPGGERPVGHVLRPLHGPAFPSPSRLTTRVLGMAPPPLGTPFPSLELTLSPPLDFFHILEGETLPVFSWPQVLPSAVTVLGH